MDDLLGKFASSENNHLTSPKRARATERKQNFESMERYLEPKESAPHTDTCQCRHGTTELANNYSETPSEQINLTATWPINLMRVITEISAPPTSAPETTFNFNLNKEAADNNAKVLEKYGNDFEKAIQAQARSPVGDLSRMVGIFLDNSRK